MAEHRARVVAVYQPGPDHIRPVGSRESLNCHLGFPIKRAAAGKRADAGDKHHSPYTCLARGCQEFLRTGHIDRRNALPAPGAVIVGTMHQRARAPEQVGINLLAETKRHRPAARLRLPRPRDDAPAVLFQLALQPAAHKTARARQDADFRISWAGLLQAFRHAPTTRSIWLSVSSGNIGKEMIFDTSASVTGKLPSL